MFSWCAWGFDCISQKTVKDARRAQVNGESNISDEVLQGCFRVLVELDIPV